MHADTNTHQRKRTESPEIEPHIWSIDFHKRCKGNSMEKIVLSTNRTRKNENQYVKKMNLDPHLIPHTNILPQNESQI